VRSTTFLFITLCTSIQKFWENAVKRRHTDTSCAALRRTAPDRPRRPSPAPPEASSAPRALEVLPFLALCADRTPHPTGRTDRRRTGGHRGVPPIAHAGRGLGPRAALMAVGAPGGRSPYKRRAPVRGGPVPRCTPSIPWTHAGESSIPRSSGEIS
jgi:hypothetical protein